MKVKRLRSKLLLATKRISEIEQLDYVVKVEKDEIIVNKYIKYFVNVTFIDGSTRKIQLDLRDVPKQKKIVKPKKCKHKHVRKLESRDMIKGLSKEIKIIENLFKEMGLIR